MPHGWCGCVVGMGDGVAPGGERGIEMEGAGRRRCCWQRQGSAAEEAE